MGSNSSSVGDTEQLELELWRVASLIDTQVLNPGLVLTSSTTAELQQPGAEHVQVCKSMEGVKLYHKCLGCSVTQHFKHCTPHSLTKESDLWCPFCMYDKRKWVAIMKGHVPLSELRMMSVFRELRIDTLVSWQVQHEFWRGCIDFWVRDYNMYIQADGSVHLCGGWGERRAAYFERDARFCSKALHPKFKVRVMRVHPDDVCRSVYLLPALSLHNSGGLVVLSPSYAAAWYRNEQGLLLNYTHAMHAALPAGTQMYRGPHGTTVYSLHPV